MIAFIPAAMIKLYLSPLFLPIWGVLTVGGVFRLVWSLSLNQGGKR